MNPVEIRLSGSGGQGLILAGLILSEAVLREGKRAAQSQAYEPVSRGGKSQSDLVIADDTPDYPLVTRLDFLLLLSQEAADDAPSIMKPEGIVLADADRVTQPPPFPNATYRLPMVKTAQTLGNPRAANMAALGALAALTGLCRPESLEAAIRERSPKSFRDVNVECMQAGFRLGNEANSAGAK